MNFLIWKVHPLTTSSSLSFVHVEDPAGKASYYKTKETASFETVSLCGR